MRLVKSGVIEWGPKIFTCLGCKDVWEVEKKDLAFWSVEAGMQWDTYNVTVAGFVCPTCGAQNQIHELDEHAALLKNERDRQPTIHADEYYRK